MDLPSGPRELNRQRWFEPVQNGQRSGLTQKVFCEQPQWGWPRSSIGGGLWRGPAR